MRRLRLKLEYGIIKVLDSIDCVFMPLAIAGLVVFSLFLLNDSKEKISDLHLELYTVNSKLDRVMADHPEIKKELASIETRSFIMK